MNRKPDFLWEIMVLLGCNVLVSTVGILWSITTDFASECLYEGRDEIPYSTLVNLFKKVLIAEDSVGDKVLTYIFTKMMLE